MSFSTARANMIDGQIKPFNVNDGRILAAFAAVPREHFLPAAQRGLAYLSEDLPLGQERFLLEPAAYARLIQEVQIGAHETVLDIGCLTGYSSYILGHLAKSVIGVDSAEWVNQARSISVPHGKNVTFETNDLSKGTANVATFDVIVINGAVDAIPVELAEQLNENGRIATFIRNERGEGHAALFIKHKNGLHKHVVFDAFIPLLPGFVQAERFVF